MGQPLDIAIIGLAGVYPGAANAAAFWQNICAKVDAITDAPADWTGPYFEADTTADDRIYTTRGGFLGELAQVDPIELGVMPSVAAGSDPDHLLALKMARDALADAGYLAAAGGRGFDGKRAGVIIARGTYGNRGLAGMLARGLFMDQMMEVIRGLRPDFSNEDIRTLQTELKQQLPPYGGDFVGVLTPNVIAGMIANRLDMMGPSYIVDAACASSLIALDAAVQELVSGRCDLMLTGGTQAQTPPQLFIQFCQINALSRDRLRPFQKGADGTLLGEGCGMLVLKRLADAERDGDRIYAVIKGVGTASDGKAKGLLAPRVDGEILALQRAYTSSGIDPLTVDLLEAHGTGTQVGDQTEIEALTAVFGGRGAQPQIALSGVKSMIGHCLPATGAASLIKTALALHHKTLPPMLCDQPDPALHLERTPFYINNATRPWIHGGDTPRRAGVNAFGFGGINAHVVLEEYVPSAAGSTPESAALNVPAGSEVLLLAADSREQLLQRLGAAIALQQGPQPLSAAELACAASQYAAGDHRLAIVCDGDADLLQKLQQAQDKLGAATAPFKTRNGIHYGTGPAAGKLCLLFPGEGSQYPGMLADLCLRFPKVRAGFDFIEDSARRRGSGSRAALLFPPPTGLDPAQRAAGEDALQAMDVAAESVFAASLALQALYDDLGLRFDAMLGHSTGENTALTACGLRRYASRQELADAVQVMHGLYQRLDAEGRIAHGTLLSIGGLDPQQRAGLLQGAPGMQLAMDNCPNQLVLFGSADAAERLREQLSAQGAICQALPFGRAYHTPLFKPMADAIRDYFAALDFGPGRVPLYSARSCAPFPEDAAAIRELTAQQWEHPVRFTETIERLYEDGYRVFLEVGPSGNLSAFVTDILRGRPDTLAIASNLRRRGDLNQLHQALAQLFATGVSFDPRRLYADRAITRFDLLAPARAAAKRPARAALRMPQLTLPAHWRRPLPTPATVVQAAAADATPLRADPAVAPMAGDPRLQALQQHFALMQDFLDSQARVLGLAAAGASQPQPPNTRHAAPISEAEYPLLGPVQLATGTQLISERSYTLDSERFLRDHCIGGTPSARDATLLAIPVIPFTFSLEICAEAAARLVATPALKVVALENARGSRWLSLDQGSVRLRIVADRRDAAGGDRADGGDARVQVRLFLLDQGGPPDGLVVFEAEVRLAADYPPAPQPLPWTSDAALPPRFNADGQLYARGMFHGPRLQGAKTLQRWGSHGIDMQLETLPTHDYFGFTQTPRLQLDAALADVLGQTYYYWLQEQHGGLISCFPYAIRRIALYAPPQPPGTAIRSRATLQVPAPDRLAGDVEACATDGRVLMRAEGWEDRCFVVPERFYQYRLQPATRFLAEVWMDGLLPPGLQARRIAPFEDDLLSQGGGIWGRGLAHMVLNREERARWYALPAAGSRRHEWLLGRIAAKEAARDWFRIRHQLQLASADIEIVGDDRGRPQVRVDALPGASMPAVSISHSRGWAAAVVADPGLAVGFDYQRVNNVRAGELIRGAFGEAEQHWFSSVPEAQLELVATALWCAKEAAAKAAGTGLQGRPLDWVISACQLDPATVAFGSAQVRRGTLTYDIALQFEAREAISALCLSTAATDGHPQRMA